MADKKTQEEKDKVVSKWSSLFSNPNRKKVKEAMEKRKKKRKYGVSKKLGM